jgi:SAM-dependent methyltransferase
MSEYVGTELEIFREAHNWKGYWSRRIAPFTAGRVLEVGAGIGANTPFLANPSVTHMLLLEPDSRFAAPLSDAARSIGQPDLRVENRIGTVVDLAASERFDTILYVDVLEHIEDDRGELAAAATHLAPGGHLVVLAPAFQWLYSPFDRAVGHYRRYTVSMLRSLTPPSVALISSSYLDGPGALLSLGNRLLRRQTTATRGQVLFWDRNIVPIATVTDVLTRRIVGRSVVCIWRARA